MSETKVCGCRICRDERDPMWRMKSPQMLGCPECGNKRCPRATDHRFACTHSNEPGQLGSDYGTPMDRLSDNALVEALREARTDLSQIGHLDDVNADERGPMARDAIRKIDAVLRRARGE